MNQNHNLKQTQILNDEKDFVKIPKSYFSLENLSLIQLGLLSKIKMLSNNNEGVCYASNRFFASFFNLSERTIDRHIKTMALLGYVHLKKEFNQYDILVRKLWVLDESIKRNIMNENNAEQKEFNKRTNEGFLDKPCKLLDKPRQLFDKPCKLLDKPRQLLDKPCQQKQAQSHTQQGLDSSGHKNTIENKRKHQITALHPREEILQPNEPHHAENVTDFDDDFFCFSELMDMGFSSENAMALIKKHGKSTIEQGFETIYNENKKNKIHNPAGYLCKLLENGFNSVNTRVAGELSEEKQEILKHSEENFEIINKWWGKNGLMLQSYLNIDLKAARKLAFELKEIVLYNPTGTTKKSLNELLNGKIATIQSIEKFAEAIIAQKEDEITVENLPDLQEEIQPNQPLKNDENSAENAILKHIQKYSKITTGEAMELFPDKSRGLFCVSCWLQSEHAISA